MECLFGWTMFLLYRWTMHVCFDDTIIICMVGWMYVELAMYGWWNYACMMKLYVLDISYVCCELAMWKIYMYHLFAVKMVGYKKKKRQCRLFAVCHRRQRALCRLPRTAKKPRGNHLCFLAADPFGQFAYSGRRQRLDALCRQPRTAKTAVSHLTD